MKIEFKETHETRRSRNVPNNWNNLSANNIEIVMEKQAYWLVSKENIHMCSAIVGGIFAIKEQISYHETNQICTSTFMSQLYLRWSQEITKSIIS